MFFRGNAGHGLEPVGVMCRTTFDCPIFHSIGNDIRNGRIQHFASFNGLFQFFIHVFWQVIPHHGIIEYIHAKNFWN